MSQLVQIQLHPNTRRINSAQLHREPCPERLALIESLTRMFGRIGMHEICRECFAGQLKRPSGDLQRECCGTCVMRGHSRCINKPLMCAIWMCGLTADKFSRTHEFLGDLLMEDEIAMEGWENEALYWRTYSVLSPEELKRLRVFRYAVDAWNEGGLV